jgi:hypothetical protein
MRTLLARQAAQPLDTGPADWLYRPPVPKGTGFMDWKKHHQLCDLARTEMERILDEGTDVPAYFAGTRNAV